MEHGRYQKRQTGQVQYEEQLKVMTFDPESDSDADEMENRQQRARALLTQPEDDEGRQWSRVMTRPVLGPGPVRVSTPLTPTTGQTRAVTTYGLVRTRPADSGRSSEYWERSEPQASPLFTPVAAASHWSSQSAFAKRAAANQKHAAAVPSSQAGGESIHARPRSGSESSFGRIFFGWRRPTNPAAAAQSDAEDGDYYENVAMETDQQRQQYRGKNLHNFSYTDAKIYSPQSATQQEKQQQQQQQPSRSNAWWKVETVGAVNSAHSNQVMMTSRGAPH